MSIAILLGTSSLSLSTSEAAVVAPTTLASKATNIVVGAQASDAYVKWRRSQAVDSAVSKLCPDFDQALDMQANPGQTVFFAKSLADTPTLEIEWWG